MATYSGVLAWRMPWTEEPGGLNPWGCKESDATDRLTLSLSDGAAGVSGALRAQNPGQAAWVWLSPCLGA